MRVQGGKRARALAAQGRSTAPRPRGSDQAEPRTHGNCTVPAGEAGASSRAHGGRGSQAGGRAFINATLSARKKLVARAAQGGWGGSQDGGVTGGCAGRSARISISRESILSCRASSRAPRWERVTPPSADPTVGWLQKPPYPDRQVHASHPSAEHSTHCQPAPATGRRQHVRQPAMQAGPPTPPARQVPQCLKHDPKNPRLSSSNARAQAWTSSS